MAEFENAPPEARPESFRTIIERKFQKLNELMAAVISSNENEKRFLNNAEKLLEDFKTAALAKLETTPEEGADAQQLAGLAKNSEAEYQLETGWLIFEPDKAITDPKETEALEAFLSKILKQISSQNLFSSLKGGQEARWRQGFDYQSAGANSYKEKSGDIKNLPGKIPGLIFNVYKSGAVYARITPEFFEN